MLEIVQEALTFDDVLLLPAYSDILPKDACLKTRKMSWRLYVFSLMVYGVGGWFAFVLPALSATG